MDRMLQKRAESLKKIIPLLFKIPNYNPEETIKKICLHIEMGESPNYISNPKAIKVASQVENIMEKHAPTVTVLQKEGHLKCPLSQIEIREEWEAECGHVFEKDAVKTYMKKYFHCPVYGCNKDLIKKR